MKVGAAQFTFLCDLLRKRTGVVIDGSKEYLVVARLTPIVRQRKIPSLDTLIDRMRKGLDPTLERDVLSAMTNPDYTGSLGNHIPIDPFFVSFIVTPICSNASELISSLAFAAKKTKKSISMT
jgi:chemotaxis protein methyltransferase CheR